MPLIDEQHDITVSTTAMASRVEVRAISNADAAGDIRAAVDEALRVFHDVDRTCTRFDAASDLMRANAGGEEWVEVDRLCFSAVVEAYAAYRRTSGRFDPRVLTDLVRLGYAESWTKRAAHAEGSDALARREPLPPWKPQFRAPTLVRLGPHAVDLGGIGKGLAVRWAAEVLRRARITDFLVEAGGDVVCSGAPADAPGWRVSVESPRGGSDPIAVLELRGEAVATSSVRLRSWQVDGRPVHHLIDPVTGAPGGDGLLAVTVVDADPARAEVWTKVLFLAGQRGVATTADLLNLPALWVDTAGVVGVSRSLGHRLIWSAQ